MIEPELRQRRADEIEAACPLRIPRHMRAGCCTWDTFITDFAWHWPRWFTATPTAEQWQWSRRDWKAGNTGFEAAHNAQRRIHDRASPAAKTAREAKALTCSLLRIVRQADQGGTTS